jgi:ribosomal protein L17
MRHRKNRLLQIRGSVQKRDLVLRTMLTNLIKFEHLTTTEKKARVLIAYADSFFATLVSMNTRLDAETAQRETIRRVKARIFGNDEGKKVVRDLIPQLVTKKVSSGFVTSVRVGKRIGDSAEQIRIQILR